MLAPHEDGPGGPSSPLISISGLTKAYPGGPEVFSGLSLEIFPGECVALIGANGSGKSTLLKCMTGVVPATSGTVNALGQNFNGSPSTRQRKALSQQLGFVFQQHGLVRRLTALSNVVHGFLGRAGSWRAWHQAIAPQFMRRRALESLETVHLGHKANARADQLSGGQAQRVAIARALVRDPDLLIADEPCASLDPAAGHDVMQQFVDLARRNNITLVFTSHDMEHARRYADRVVALKDGKVFFDQRSSDLDQNDLRRVFDG